MNSNNFDIIDLIRQPENSQLQFKENVYDSKKLAEELVAFSNAEGGRLLIGIADNGELIGLNNDDIQRLNQLISNTCNENIKPPIYPLVEFYQIDENKVLSVSVRKGTQKPYCTSSGIYYTKSGADKRKVSPEELRRLFAESSLHFADEMIHENSSLNDINYSAFDHYFINKRGKSFKESGLRMENVLQNLNLMANECLTLSGILFFAQDPQSFYPAYTIQALVIDGDDLSSDNFIDKKYFSGNLRELLDQSLMFLKSHLRNQQDKTTFNTVGALEIEIAALEEALVNALIHRDYLISSSIKIIVYKNRVEIISPGKLPNSLNVDKIKSGLSIARNPILHSIAPFVLEYSGFGTGIERILSKCPNTLFVNDTEKETFTVIFERSSK
jgi:predicted HTH transcriptional regulator